MSLAAALARLQDFANKTAIEPAFYPQEALLTPRDGGLVVALRLRLEPKTNSLPEDTGSSPQTHLGVFPPLVQLAEGDKLEVTAPSSEAGQIYVVVPPILEDFTLGYTAGLLLHTDTEAIGFNVYTLTFTPTATGFTIDPITGNQYPNLTTPITAIVRLRQTRDVKTLEMAGANVDQLVLVGHWGAVGERAVKPTSVQWGMTSPLELNGVQGWLTIHSSLQQPLKVASEIYGESIMAIWEAAR